MKIGWDEWKWLSSYAEKHLRDYGGWWDDCDTAMSAYCEKR